MEVVAAFSLFRAKPVWTSRIAALRRSTTFLLLARTLGKRFGDGPSATVKSGFLLFASGDLLYSGPIAQSNDPELSKVLRIVRAVDVAITNQECPLLDLGTLKRTGYGDGLLVADP